MNHYTQLCSYNIQCSGLNQTMLSMMEMVQYESLTVSKYLGGTDHADPHGYFRSDNYGAVIDITN